MSDPEHVHHPHIPLPTDTPEKWENANTMIMTTTAARLDPAHWRYLAEGKLHVVVAFENSGGDCDGPPSPFRHHVLRLLKERHPDAVGAGAASALYDAAREREYLERVAGPALGFQYVDLGWTVPVTREFLEGVAARCVGGPSIVLYSFDGCMVVLI